MPTMVSFREDVTYAPTKSTLKTKTRQRRKPYLHQEHYLCDFYENIWTPMHSKPEREIPGSLPATAAARLAAKAKSAKATQRKERKQFVDIAQIAYALTATTEYRTDYQPTSRSTLNIWSMTLPSDGYESADDVASVDGKAGIPSLRSTPAGIILKSTNAKPRQSTITEESRDSLAPTHDDPTLEVDDLDDPRMSSFTADQQHLHGAGLTRKPRPELVQPSRMRDSKSAKMLQPLSVDMAIPPPSKMNGSVVFSTVFMEKGEWGWSIRFLLGLHEPVRHALYVMDRFLAQSHQQQHIDALEEHTREFFEWFNTYFVEYLKTQHEIKMNVLIPWVKFPYQAKQEITRTCDEIYEILAHIQAQEQALLANPSRHDRSSWLLRLDALQKSIRRLNMTVHTVLNLEEQTLHCALAEAFTEKNFRNYVLPRVFRTIKAKKVVVPWMIERIKVWGGEAEQQSFQGMLPFSSKFLYKKIWRPYFISNVAVAMKHLNEWDPDSPERRQERPELFGCAIQ